MRFSAFCASRRGLRAATLSSVAILALAATGALADSHSPTGGGTLTTTNSGDTYIEFGPSGGIELQPTAGDTITATSLSRNNTGGGTTAEALDVGITLPSTGSYTMIFHGNSLTGLLFASGIGTTNGNLTIDTTGGAANSFSGFAGLAGNVSVSGNLSINTGADTFSVTNGNGLLGEVEAGNITINSLGSTINVSGTGIGLQALTGGGSSTVTIGNLNGGFAGTINAANGSGIVISDAGLSQATDNVITLAPSGVVNAKNALIDTGNNTFDIYGSITGTTAALTETTTSNVYLKLEKGSTLSGAVNFFSGNGPDQVTLYAGSHVSNATFNFSTSGNILTLRGAGSDTFDGSKVTGGYNINVMDSGSTWTLTNVSGVTGGIAISSGATAVVNGTLAGTSLAVGSSGTVKGTGTLPNTLVGFGGILAPGNGIGTINVNGTLTFLSTGIYQVEVSPSAADKTAVTGAATLAGTLQVVDTGGSYAASTKYTVLTATGGLAGTTFTSLNTSSLPSSLKASLSYDANDVYLTIGLNSLSLSGANINETNSGGGINNALAAGATLSTAFSSLFNLTGANLNAALDQIEGQIGPNVISSVSQNFMPFLDLMLGQASGGEGGTMTSSLASDGIHPAQLTSGPVRVWGTAYGGHTGISADATTGAASLSANNMGLAVGAETQLADGLPDNLLIGGSIAYGRQFFSSGNGTGNTSDVLAGIYARQAILGEGYVAGSFGYGWHKINTMRVVTVSGTDVLAASFDANEYGGRIEGGWRLLHEDMFDVTPYAAFAGESFDTPSYNETAVSGASTFALSYASHSTAVEHSELGLHIDQNLTGPEAKLNAEVIAAWAHSFEDTPYNVAAFQGLAGSSFTVFGVRPANDTALLGLHLNVEQNDGIGYGMHFDSQIGSGTTILQGTGNISYRW